MARQTKRLTARTVATLTKVGRHADGGNLYLTISKAGDGLSKRWTFMFAIAGRQREAGFGSAATVTLAQAREKAGEYRSMLAKGIGPNRRKEGRHGGRCSAANVWPVRRRADQIEALRMA
jgi:hypothetical protein